MWAVKLWKQLARKPGQNISPKRAALLQRWCRNALAELGWAVLGEPNWGLGGLRVSAVYPLELGFLGLGLIGSCIVAIRLARQDHVRAPLRAFLPWLVLHVLLWASAMWLLAQPMEMRGTFLGG